MNQVVVICSQCMGGFEPSEITVVPRFRESIVARHSSLRFSYPWISDW